MRNIFTFVVIFQGVIFYSLYRVMVTHFMNISGFTVLFSAMTAVAWMVIGSLNAIIQSYEDSLKRAGVYEKVCRLPHGTDTILTKEFAEDGAVLSGGELQKIAVARAFAKDYKIAIFPSSALAPFSEYRLNQAMLEVTKDKTVIFISHRLSSTVMADRIYMLEQGNIIEQGSHKELMALEGKYAQMFRMQAEKYNIL